MFDFKEFEKLNVLDLEDKDIFWVDVIVIGIVVFGS